ncbi:MAG: rod shape-determining protein MreC [Dehalococcoidia bacterium]
MLVVSRYGWWIAAMLSLAVFLMLAGQFGVLQPFEGLFLRVSTPVERGLEATFRPVANVLSDAGGFDDLRAENNRLRLENETLKNEIVQLEQENAQIEDLLRALGVSSSADDTYVVSRVIARDSSPFTDRVRIDQGTNAGIRTGMVVFSSGLSLVGTVIETRDTYAWVRLITDASSKVNGQIVESQINGSVQGHADRSLTFELTQGNVNVGDTIVTSGIGGNYPPGRTIGTVAAVSGTPQDISRTVRIEPLVRMGTLEIVQVLTSFQAQRLDLD